MRLLAIDIGNTNINLAIFRGNKIIKKFIIPTYDYGLGKLKPQLKNSAIDKIYICSVVPKITKTITADLKKLTNKKAIVIGKDIFVPIKNLYRNPKHVGQDRLVNAYAAVKLYKAPAIIVDFGTAITFDIISKKGEYLGGMILPGLGISLHCLNEKTALLPNIKLEAPREFIGRDTKQGMLSGIVYGFSALTSSLSNRIREKIGKEALLIGTGGNISLISKFCKNFDKQDIDLTLKGIKLISLVE